jgi:hypothetical protein
MVSIHIFIKSDNLLNCLISGFPETAADLLNDWVLPIFEEEEIPVLRVLTD